MGFALTQTAAQPRREKPTSPRKTASGEFFTNPNKTRPANRRQPLKTLQGKPAHTYKTASGRPFWPSRDPLGDEAFFKNHVEGKKAAEIMRLRKVTFENLYAFVTNDAVNKYDDKGLAAPVAVAAVAVGVAAACLSPHFYIALNKYPNDEAKRHCYASCIAARTCGTALSALAGIGFEVLTGAIEAALGADVDPLLENALLDERNNLRGIECAGWECHVNMGNVGRWFRQSCEKCCE